MPNDHTPYHFLFLRFLRKDVNVFLVIEYNCDFLNCIVKKSIIINNLAGAGNMQATPFPSTMTMAVPMSAMQPMPYGFHQQQVLVFKLRVNYKNMPIT